MKRIYHPFHVWEDWKSGMWRKVSGKEEQEFLLKAIEFTGDAELYGQWMNLVTIQWPYACEHNLTDLTQNRRAWIGHAAACLALGIPEHVTRSAWGALSRAQQEAANDVADQAISAWERLANKGGTVKRVYSSLNVLEAAKERISWAFDSFPNLYCSFSGGKDSTVMTHLVMEEARARRRRVGLLFIDWECQITSTIDHVRSIFHEYRDVVDPYWISLPIRTWNGCSQFEPEWTAWEDSKQELWVRTKEPGSIQDPMLLPFYFPTISFEEFVELFAHWFGGGQPTACFVGIRTQESLNRFRTIASSTKSRYEGKAFTTKVIDEVYNVYPIYDWATEDDWAYLSKFRKSYNSLYDRFYQAGLSIHQMRIDEPFGDTQRKNLWLYQVIEPALWAKMVIRVSGANTANLYSRETGNVMGNGKVQLPAGHTWKSFALMLLDTMPKKTAEHYKGKIAVYTHWFSTRGYPEGIPDESPWELESINKAPAWRRVVRTLLRNDYWCRGMGFSPTKSQAYQKYMDLMKRRRKAWGIFPDTEEGEIESTAV